MFSKYLPSFGWTPFVFTRIFPENDSEWQSAMHIEGLPSADNRLTFVYGKKEEEGAFQKKSFLEILKRFFYPDLMQPPGLAEQMIKVGQQAKFKRKIHVVYGTSPDFCALSVAATLAKKLKVPWVADFRDIHEQDKAVSFRAKLLSRRIAFRRRQLVRSAAAIITVSEHHAEILSKSTRKNVHVIQNGFDPSMFYPQPRHRCKKFSIVYMGRILSEWLQNPRPLFEGLDILLTNGIINPEDLEILFYGTEPVLLKNLASSYVCEKYIHPMKRVDFKDVPYVLRKSCILLTLTNKGRHGILTTKVFEYLGVRRPIICVPGDEGELDKLIQDANAGFSCPDAMSVAAVIKKWYEEWQQTGTVVCQSMGSEIQKYSREYQAGQLAVIFDKICSVNP
jgi:hypothetical protein